MTQQAHRAQLTRTVTSDDTARALGSGDLEVLGTPRLLAWCELATCLVAEPLLDPGTTTVGVGIELQHLAASALGSTVQVVAGLAEVQERTFTFTVRATDPGDGRTLATATVTRVMVDAQRFLARVPRP